MLPAIMMGAQMLSQSQGSGGGGGLGGILGGGGSSSEPSSEETNQIITKFKTGGKTVGKGPSLTLRKGASINVEASKSSIPWWVWVIVGIIVLVVVFVILRRTGIF